MQGRGRSQLHRRQMLHVGALSAMGLGLSNLLAAEAQNRSKGTGARARSIILIWLSGGPSTIDMWDLKPQAKSNIRGEFKPVDTTAEGVQICEHLPKMAEQMQHCTLIRSARHTIAEHSQGTEYVITGNPISPALKYPSIGSIVSSQVSATDRSVPAYMDLSSAAVGQAGYLGASHNPFVVRPVGQGRRRPRTDMVGDQLALPEGFTVSDLARRGKLLADVEEGFRRFDKTTRADEMSEFQRQALDILTAGKTRAALNVFAEKEEVRQRYTPSPLGLSALAARRLVQAGVRFVTIGLGGWDTHANNFTQLRDNLLPQLDTALAALVHDLDSLGLLDETVVYCVGEFNRTPTINSQSGRDHWARSMSALVAGGGFKRGFVYGSTDTGGFEPATSPCSPADINATILNQLQIGPETRLRTRSGRPMPLFRDGELLHELMS